MGWEKETSISLLGGKESQQIKRENLSGRWRVIYKRKRGKKWGEKREGGV